MKAIQGYYLIKPEDLRWRPSNLMKIPNADYLERTGSENIGARLWITFNPAVFSAAIAFAGREDKRRQEA